MSARRAVADKRRRSTTKARVLKPKRVGPSDARARFLVAADRVFLRLGYNGTTIRAIAKEAGTSLGHLSRHWSGKEALFREVFARHFDRIHAAQLLRLDEVERAAAGAAPTVKSVLQAFYDPALQAGAGSPIHRLSHMVYCRALVDAAPPVRRLVAELIREVAQRVIALLRRALPAQDSETFYLIVALAMGAYIQPQLFGMQLARAVGVRYRNVDWSRAGTVMAAMVEGGIRSLETARKS
jgi:AcrR family transcriptional regulator